MKKTILKNGVIDFYSTFEVFDNTQITVDELFNKAYPKSLMQLSKSKLIISYNSSEKEIGLNDSFINYLNRRKKEYLQTDWKKKNHHFQLEFQKRSSNYNSFDNFGNPIPYFFSDTEGEAIDLLEYSQYRSLEHFVESLNYEERYSGLDTLTTKNSIMLFPIKIMFPSGELGFVDITITIFKHGYSYINASLRINNYPISELSQDLVDFPIKSAYFPKFMLESDSENDEYEYKKVGRCTTMDAAMSRYLKYLQESIFEHVSSIDKFTSISLLDMDSIPNTFSTDLLEKSTTFKKDIFFLLFAPIPEHRVITKTDHNKINDRSLIATSEVMFYANEHRLIFALANQENALESFNKINNGVFTDSERLEAQYQTYGISVPFLLEKVLLKKYSSLKYFNQLLRSKELIELKKIKELRIFELGFEEIPIFYNYASTRTLFNFLFESCIDLNTTKIIDDLIKRSEDLIALNKTIQSDRLSYGSAVFAIVFTALFSIEGIEDILRIFGNTNPTAIKRSYFLLLSFVLLIIIYIFKDKFIDLKNKLLSKFINLKNKLLSKFISLKNKLLNSKTNQTLKKLHHYIFKVLLK